MTDNLEISLKPYQKLWALALPLMLSYLANTMMILADRMILAQYSLPAMNAAAIIGTVVFLIQYFFATIAILSEVLIGKANGSNNFLGAARPAWQMIWMGLATILPFVLLAKYMGQYLIPAEYFLLGEDYYKITLYFASFYVLAVAFVAFFVAIGESKIIIISTIMGNLINIVLDFLLIFGFRDIIPEMGIKGAAIASVIGMLAQLIILMLTFFQKKYRVKYSTHKAIWCLKTLLQCLKLGLPSAIGITLEIAAWSYVFYFLPSISMLHITIFSIGQTVFITFTFISDGLKKALVSIISNYIGSGQEYLSKNIIKIALIHYTIICLVLVVVSMLLSVPIMDFFLANNADQILTQTIYNDSKLTIGVIFIFFMIEGYGWIFGGYLAAKEKVMFIMLVSALNAWVVSVLPMYIAFKYFHLNYLWVWVLFSGYGVSSGIILGIKTLKLLRRQPQA